MRKMQFFIGFGYVESWAVEVWHRTVYMDKVFSEILPNYLKMIPAPCMFAEIKKVETKPEEPQICGMKH